VTGEESAAALELGGRVAAGVAGIAQDVQRAVVGRVERLTGAPAVPVHAAHKAISTGVYAAVRGGITLAAKGMGLAAAARADGRTACEATTPRAAAVVAALNGAAGGLLADEGSPWAVQMATRVQGEPRPKVAVLLHGLGESDLSWRSDPDYRALLRQLGWTPVLVRYNTGRRVWQNGAELSTQLDALLDTWAVPVSEVALVGHSMGGLVARSAVHAGERQGAAWTRSVTRLITLGTPHEGAPLARFGHLARGLLSRVPETRPFAAVIDFDRAPGIDDLRRGDIHEAPEQHGTPLPDHIRVSTLCATLARDERHLVSRLLGDLLVTAPSATSASSGRRGDDDRRHLGGLHHFDLLGHPEVADQLREWMR
jgi:pimeloyl-ACP methyl ester carboxylesterase